MQTNKKCVCEKTCFGTVQSAEIAKTRITHPEKVDFIFNECMHQMTRNALGVVKLLMGIYLCPECGNGFFLNPHIESHFSGMSARHLHCLYCGEPVRDNCRMTCQLTRECFNLDKTKCECRKEYCMTKHGEAPHVGFKRNSKDAAFVRSICDRIMSCNTGDDGVTLIPMHYCTEHKLIFAGNSEKRIQYCLYCGQPAHEAEQVYCFMTEDCFDLKNICENEFKSIR